MSCHDNDDVEPLVQLNKYRAKEIKGHNALWGTLFAQAKRLRAS